MKLFRCESLALPALLLLTTADVNAFAFFGGGYCAAAGLLPRGIRRPSPSCTNAADHHAAGRRRAVRMAAEAKNASEISHENVVEYREKLSIIPRANGEDSEVCRLQVQLQVHCNTMNEQEHTEQNRTAYTVCTARFLSTHCQPPHSLLSFFCTITTNTYTVHNQRGHEVWRKQFGRF